MTPDELWEKYSNLTIVSGRIGRTEFLAALAEYATYIGAKVRARDAAICDELCEQETMSKHINVANCRAARSAMDQCAAAISREALP